MTESLRVLLSFSTRIGTGGVGTTAWHQATGLARAGAEVSVACGSVERELPGVRVVAETMRIGPAKVPYRLLGFDRSTAYHDRRVARLVGRREGEFDVVHSWPAGAQHTLRAARARGLLAVLERPNAHTAFAYEAVAAECARLGIAVDPARPHAFDAARLARAAAPWWSPRAPRHSPPRGWRARSSSTQATTRSSSRWTSSPRRTERAG